MSRPSSPPSGASHAGPTLRPEYATEVELVELDPSLRAMDLQALSGLGALGLDDPTMELRGSPVVLIEPDPLLGRILAGEKYEVDSLVGSGANGAVYKARHLDLRRDVAVKVLHPHFQADREFGKRFQREAMAASQLDHPNILRVIDFGQEPDGLSYIVMELLAGATLRAMLEAEKRLAPERAVALISQVLLGLAVAHEAGIVHRDVKPDNVVVVRGRDEEGAPLEVAKVCDFGIAALSSAHAEERSLAPSGLPKSTGGGYWAGTPAYMSPEQARGEAPHARDDLYACASTLYELVTGRAPFEGTNVDLATARLTEEPPSAAGIEPQVPAALAGVLAIALAKDHQRRPQTARELRTMLRDAMEATAREREAREEQRAPSPPRPVDANALLGGFVLSFAAAVAALTDAKKNEIDEVVARSHALLVPLLEVALEVSFVRRDTPRGLGMFLLLGNGDALEMKALLGSPSYEEVGMAFLREVARHELPMITLHPGISDASLANLARVLVGKADAAKVLAAGAIAGVSAIVPSQIVLRDRKLPWKVGLSLSRLARDLSWAAAANEREDRVTAKLSELAALTAAFVRKPEELLVWLDNVEDAISSDKLARELRARVVAAIPLERAVGVGALMLAEIDSATARRVDARGLLVLLKERMTNEARTPATFELLCDLGLRGVVPPAELPEDVGLVVRANLLARNLGRNHAEYLAALSAMDDVDGLQRELTVLKGALRVLAKRGEALPLLSAITALARLARAKPEPGVKERLALKVITSVVTHERLLPIANVVMLGQAHAREAAKQLLALSGEAGARALVTARSTLREPSGRAQFVDALAGMGAHGSLEVARVLSTIDPAKDAADVTLVEDLLLGVPGRPSAAVAAELPRFLAHASFTAAAQRALAAVSERPDTAAGRVVPTKREP